MQFNGELLDPQQIYLQLAKGSYVGRDPQAQIALQELLAVPLMGPLLWYGFYNLPSGLSRMIAGQRSPWNNAMSLRGPSFAEKGTSLTLLF